ALASISKPNSLPTRFLDLSESNIIKTGEFSNRVVSEQSHDEISKAISKKCKFGELWRLGRKLDDDLNHDIANNDYSIIQNPVDQKLKGRSKKSDSKRIKSVTEAFNVKASY
ncbi:9326_t:CDS:2, partial [Gigaspora rosea]